MGTGILILRSTKEGLSFEANLEGSTPNLGERSVGVRT